MRRFDGEAFEEGFKKAREEVVCRMLSANMSVDTITVATGLTKEKVLKIANKHSTENERLILKNDRFVVVRDFYKIGSLILEYNKETHRRFVGDANTLRSIATGNIQVIPMGGPNAKDVYSEYKPYTVVPIDQIDDVINMVLKGDLPLEVNIYMKDNPYVTK